MNSNSQTIDTNLFSRQIGAIGTDSTKKLLNLKICFIGCDTIAIECMKCLCLMGVNKFSIYDPTNISLKYSARLINYTAFSGTNLSEYAAAFIKSLNSNASIDFIIRYKIPEQLQTSRISIAEIERNFETLGKPDCIIYTNELLMPLLSVQALTRHLNIKLLSGFNNGLFGYLFVDFNNHVSYDPDGEIIESSFIERFEINSNENSIDLYIEKGVEFKYCKNITIFGQSDLKFNVECVKYNFNPSNIITVKKTDELVQLLQNKNTSLRIIDNKPITNIVHSEFKEYITKCQYSYLNCKTSFATNDELYTEYMQYLMEPSKILSKQFDRITMDSRFYPLGCIIGGMLAHEVIKLTGKYIPINQDILFNYEELKPSTFVKNTKNGATYDLIACVDKDFVNLIKNKSLFIVGAGALGCELSKNLAIMGFSQSSKTPMYITDMDNVSYSNLSRQFLFSYDDVGKSKSSVVNDKIQAYFKRTHSKYFNVELRKHSDTIFGNKFWNNLDFIVNALDNVEARKYVDNKAVLYGKPLFDSGTLGSKCSSQSIIPFKTATYSEINDPAEKSIPVCTIHNFPNKIEHCIEWCLDLFDKVFTTGLSDLSIVLQAKNDNLDFYNHIQSINNTVIELDRLILVNLYLKLITNPTNTQFIEFVNNIYSIYYYKPVKVILESFPDDLTDEFNNKFWSGKRLKPVLIDLDEYQFKNEFFNELYGFITDGLGVKLANFNSSMLTEYKFSEYTENINRKVIIDTKKQQITYEINNDSIENIKKQIETNINLYKSNSELHYLDLDKLQSIKYDKDDNTMLKLFHEFSTIRAKLYTIDVGDIIQTQLISGKIIPALSSTTTVISGFVMLDIIKYLLDKKYTDTNINLATNQCLVFDSNKPKETYDGLLHPAYGIKVKTIPDTFNTWNKIEINKIEDDCHTLDALLCILNDNNIIPTSITVETSIIYDSANPPENMKKIFLDEFIAKKAGIKPSGKIELNIAMFDENGLPVLIPRIVYVL